MVGGTVHPWRFGLGSYVPLLTQLTRGSGGGTSLARCPVSSLMPLGAGGPPLFSSEFHQSDSAEPLTYPCDSHRAGSRSCEACERGPQ